MKRNEYTCTRETITEIHQPIPLKKELHLFSTSNHILQINVKYKFSHPRKSKKKDCSIYPFFLLILVPPPQRFGIKIKK